MVENKWHLYKENLEGPTLVLGPGFDFDTQILVSEDGSSLIIRTAHPSSQTDPNYPYPSLKEITVPISQLKELLDKGAK